VHQFRTSVNAFLQQLFKVSARALHIHPATALSASIELGRTLLPVASEEVYVWEWQAPHWKPTLRLKRQLFGEIFSTWTLADFLEDEVPVYAQVVGEVTAAREVSPDVVRLLAVQGAEQHRHG